MSTISLVVTTVLLCCFYSSSGSRFGPQVIASKGEVWPKPQLEEKSPNYFTIQRTFTFQVAEGVNCPNFLNDALDRYWTIIADLGSQRAGSLKMSLKRLLDDNYLGVLDSQHLETLKAVNTLTLTESEQVLSAPNIWGILRGLETFSQLLYPAGNALEIRATTIEDFPRFSHRGLLLDTSRHFEPLNLIFKTLDAMSYNKLNVFHWHIVDDQSFPYQSLAFPELSNKGAFPSVHDLFYSQTEIQEVIEYARLRGIRVVVEFDVPGHTQSWGQSHPELLTTCYENGEPNGELGPMDPTKESTYEFLEAFFAEVAEVFPDAYIHIGGDEVDFTCWESNPDVNAFMAANNLTTYQQLEGYFVQKVVDYINTIQHKQIVWEEVFVDGVNIEDTTLVQVWKSGDGLTTLSQVTAAGKWALYSSCWYLDALQWGGDWQKYYQCEPLDFVGTDEQKALVLGGEACMWSEVVNEYNLMSRVWPRASAAAERLWSAADVTDLEDAQARIEEHTCRMNARGIGAQPPNGAGFCF